MPLDPANEKRFRQFLRGTSSEKVKCFVNGVNAQGQPLPGVVMGVTLARVRTLASEELERRTSSGVSGVDGGHYLSGPLTITVQHGLSGGDTVYQRSGVPSIWGDGLVHEDIEGVDDDPVFGEATGPVAPPGGGFNIGIAGVLGVLGLLALGAAVMLPEKRKNPTRRRRSAKARRRFSGRSTSASAWEKRKYGADYVPSNKQRRRRLSNWI